jgi:hypothetical protein
MGLPFYKIGASTFGGGNWNDQQAGLIYRSHRWDGKGWTQLYPMESPNLRNIDFAQRAIGKRKGSALLESLASVMVASETILLIGSWVTPGTTTEVHVAVGVKSMYTDQSGSWAQINDSASSAYTHAADVSKCSATACDNHLIIGLNGANPMQVYRSGADLDDPLVSTNTWNDSFGGGTSTVSGTHGNGAYIVFTLHERLCYSTGNGAIQYSNFQQPWERLDANGGGYFGCRGNVIAALSFTPRGGDELQAVGFISTTAGPQFITGFDGGISEAAKEVHTAWRALNHRCLVPIENWIVAMTSEGGFRAINLADDIDLGRRFFALDGSSGPLDTFSATNANHPTHPFGFYNQKKKQVSFFYPDASNSNNSHAAVLDFFLGEPIPGEDKDSYERRVRLGVNTIDAPGTNAWFRDVYQRRGNVVGALGTGLTYTLDSGYYDLGTLAIREYWELPDLDGGEPDRIKMWQRLLPVFREVGDWDVSFQPYLDLASSPTGDPQTFTQITAGSVAWGSSTWGGGVWSGEGVVTNAEWQELESKFFRGRFYNQAGGQNWTLPALTLEYQIGARSD